MEEYLFSVYGLSVRHPKKWDVLISPRSSFSRADGFVKIEEVDINNETGASLGLRWEEANTTSEKFANKYLNEIENQYKKSLKKSKTYKFITKKIIDFNGHKACYIETRYSGSNKLFSKPNKDNILAVLQLAFYCDNSSKIIVATITASLEKLESSKDDLNDILFSIKCH